MVEQKSGTEKVETKKLKITGITENRNLWRPTDANDLNNYNLEGERIMLMIIPIKNNDNDITFVNRSNNNNNNNDNEHNNELAIMNITMN